MSKIKKTSLSIVRSDIKNVINIIDRNIKNVKKFSCETVKKVKIFLNRHPLIKKTIKIIVILMVGFFIFYFFNINIVEAIEPVINKGKKSTSKKTAKARSAAARAKISKEGGTRVLHNGVEVIKPTHMEKYVNSVYGTKKLNAKRAELWAAASVGSVVLSPTISVIGLTAMAGTSLYFWYKAYKNWIKK